MNNNPNVTMPTLIPFKLTLNNTSEGLFEATFPRFEGNFPLREAMFFRLEAMFPHFEGMFLRFEAMEDQIEGNSLF